MVHVVTETMFLFLYQKADGQPNGLLACNVSGETKEAPFSCIACWDEAVTGFTVADLSVTNAILSGILDPTFRFCALHIGFYSYVSGVADFARVNSNVYEWTFLVWPTGSCVECNVDISIPDGVVEDLSTPSNTNAASFLTIHYGRVSLSRGWSGVGVGPRLRFDTRRHPNTQGGD